MSKARCARCGKSSKVDELAATPESAWLHCRHCGYMWRGPGLDAFPLIVCSRALDANPVAERCPPAGVDRASRFAVRVPVRYRTASDPDWRDGLTENISPSGVLFQTGSPVAPRTPVEMLLLLPGTAPHQPAYQVACLGEVVRTQRLSAPDSPSAVAVQVGSYRLSAAG